MCVPESESESVSVYVSVSVPVTPYICVSVSVSAVGRLLHFALKKKLVFSSSSRQLKRQI